MSRRGTGGSAGSSGYEYQARAIAYVAAHMLLRQPLKWTRKGFDVPVTLQAEIGRSGDDVQIQFEDGGWSYSVQAKLRVSGKAELLKAMHGFLTDLPSRPGECGILAIGPTTHVKISTHLADDLDRLRDGRNEPLHEVAHHLLGVLTKRGEPDLHLRLYVVSLALAADSAEDRKWAVRMLLSLVDQDWRAGERLWEALVHISRELMNKRGRHTRESLVDLLRFRGHTLAEPEAPQHDEVLRLVRELHVAAGLGTDISVSASAASAGEASPEDPREVQWQAQLDLARQLLEGQNPAPALKALLSLDGTLQAATPPPRADLRRRVRSNIGVALIHLGRPSEAASVFESALEFAPNDPVTLTNLAKVELSLGKDSAAEGRARRVLQNDDRNPVAWAILVQLGLERLEGVPPTIAENPAILTAAGLFDLRHRPAEEAGEALALLRRAADTQQDPFQLFLLANGLMRGWEGGVLRSNVPGRIVQEAERLTGQALELLGAEAGFSVLHEQLLLLRATARRALNRDSDAFRDAERALRLHPAEAPEVWRPVVLLAGMLLERGEPARALNILEAYPGEGGEAAIHLTHARVLMALGREAEVGPLLERAVEHGAAGNELRLAAIEVALDARLTDFAARLLYAGKGKDGWLGDLFAARLAVQRGDLEAAAERFNLAANAAEADVGRRVRYEFAIVLARRRKFAEAVEQLRAADAWNLDDSFKRPYATALLEAGEVQELHARIAALEADGSLPVWASRLAADLAYVLDDTAELIRHLEAVFAVEPDSVDAALRLATTYADHHRADDAVRLFRDLTHRPDLAPDQRMHLASQLFRLGHKDEALWQGFRAVREDRNDPELQRAFVALVTSHEQRSTAFLPVEVGADTHVRLVPRRKGSSVGYTLLSADPVDNQRNEFLAHDPRMAFLLGKKVGDHVVLRRNMPSEERYRVKAIKSAVVHLYQDIISHFGERFPDDSSIQKYPIGKNPSLYSLSPIISQLQQLADHEKAVLAWYERQPIPLGAMAKALGRDADLVYGVLVTRGQPYRVESGDAESLAHSLNAAGRETPVVFTLSAALTAQRLAHTGVDALGILAGTDRQILVPQSLIRELEERTAELDRHRGSIIGTITTGPAGIHVHQETPAEAEQNYRDMLEILTWVQTHASVCPRPLIAVATRDEQKREVLGTSSADALDLVAGKDADLFADDLGLRIIGGVGERSFSTWALLHVVAARAQLPPRTFRLALRTLVRLNFSFIPLDAKTLLEALHDSSYQLDREVTPLFQRLGDPDLEVEGLIRVVGELLRELALSEIGGALLAPVTHILLEAVTSSRRIVPTVNLLQRDLDNRMILLPLQRRTIQEVINRFTAEKRAGGSLQ